MRMVAYGQAQSLIRSMMVILPLGAVYGINPAIAYTILKTGFFDRLERHEDYDKHRQKVLGSASKM